MKFAVRQALSCSVLILAASTAGYAQSISAGTIEGTVTDPTGAAIGKAAVTIRNAISTFEFVTFRRYEPRLEKFAGSGKMKLFFAFVITFFSAQIADVTTAGNKLSITTRTDFFRAS